MPRKVYGTRKLAKPYRGKKVYGSRQLAVPMRRMNWLNKSMIGTPKPHYFTRTFEGPPLPMAVLGGSVIEIAPTFNDLPAVGDFTSLYDQYKIYSIKVRIENAFTSNELFDSNTTPGNANTTAKYYRVVYDADGIGPTTELDAFQYKNMRSYNVVGQKPIVFKFRPKIQATVSNNNTPSASATAVTSSKWIDMADRNVKHYGAYIYVPQVAPLTNGQSSRTIVTVTFGCKGIR